MSEQRKKLVGEIRKRFSQLPTLMVLGQVATQEGKELLSDTFIHSLITLILSAVPDGLELPDEVGRWEWPSDKPAAEAVSKWATRITHQKRANQLIALSGTGKEEEG